MAEAEDFFEPRVYEVGFHVVPTIPEEKVAGEISFIKDALARGNASVISEEFPRLRSLAYTFKRNIGGKYEKHQSSYFGWIKFEGGRAVVTDLTNLLKSHPSVIRFLIVRTVRENTMVSARPPLRRSHAAFIPKKSPVTAETPAPTVSEAELDTAIQKLVVE
jgi:ribosomal protein S6